MHRITIVTGAGSGIGYATSIKLASNGYVVVMGDISKDIVDKAEKVGSLTRSRTLGLTVDVSDWNSCKEFTII